MAGRRFFVTHMHTYMHAQMHIHMHTHMHTYMHVLLYTYEHHTVQSDISNLFFLRVRNTSNITKGHTALY